MTDILTKLTALLDHPFAILKAPRETLQDAHNEINSLRADNAALRKLAAAAIAWNNAPYFSDGAEIEALIDAVDEYLAQQQREKGAPKDE